jgi:DNA-binding NarL/FixJ family response regulator
MKVEKRGRKPSLTAEEMREVIRLDAEGWTYEKIAGRFGLTKRTIGKIVTGK